MMRMRLAAPSIGSRILTYGLEAVCGSVSPQHEQPDEKDRKAPRPRRRNKDQ
ncbi:MAG: hypothetical protein JST42_31205 [Bacteroidetes bacterium]|nr:hypothetical protein [Bacteroidota bacterium]